MQAIASAATAVVAGYLAAGTSTIRIGAGGIMLPNHSPLVIAEQFGTLESLYPGRIDLGLGRAPGTDQLTARALRRDPLSADRFPRDVQDLQVLFGPARDTSRSVPFPERVSRCRSGSSARAPSAPAWPPCSGFRTPSPPTSPPPTCWPRSSSTGGDFRPSAQLAEPYTMAGLNVYAADTDEEARRLFTTPQQSWANRFRGLPAPTHRRSTTSRRTGRRPRRRRRRRCSRARWSGRPRPCVKGVEQFRELTGVDELMVVSAMTPASYGAKSAAAHGSRLSAMYFSSRSSPVPPAGRPLQGVPQLRDRAGEGRVVELELARRPGPAR